MINRLTLVLSGFVALLLAGCQAPTDLDIPITIPPQASPTAETIVPTPLPPEKTLIVCVQQEPESLYIYSEAYLYGGTGRESNTILQALYDGPIDLLQAEIHPVILKELPNFDSGSARFETVEVGKFEVYLNPVTLQAENLRLGNRYLPSECQSPDCIQNYEGGLVAMDRMVVDFNMREDVVWSDGVSLTAGDSVFSYELDRDGASPTTKYLVDRTQSYTAINEWTVQWIGIPGFSDLEYQTTFWHPLPRHLYADQSAESMQGLDDVNYRPMGWGPYLLEGWIEGDRIEMVRNQQYFRLDEGLPYFDRLIFRFLGSDPRTALQQLLTAECDVLDETLLSPEIWSTLIEYQEEDRLQLLFSPAGEVLRLDFNTDPVGRPGEAFFQTTQLRQAVAACIDREHLSEKYMYGLGNVPDSFHLNDVTLGQDQSIQDYDPARGRELVRFLGWVDEDEDPATAQVGWDVPGVYNGKRLETTLLIPREELYEDIAQEMQAMLFECGFEVTIDSVSAEELTDYYPDGVAFGRGFDMVMWSWPDWRLPLCEMFASREIPSETYPYGVNASGFSNRAYDMACDRLLLGDHDQTGLSIREVLTIFNEQLPALPLIQPPRLLVVAEDVCGIEIDSMTPSLFWNLEEIARGEGC